MTDKPVPLILTSFLAMSPAEQLKYFESDLLEDRGISNMALRALLNSIQNFMPYFFDFFPNAGGEKIAAELGKAIEMTASSKDAKKKLLDGPEWNELRQLARKLLDSDGVEPCSVPRPLPLREWADHIDWGDGDLHGNVTH